MQGQVFLTSWNREYEIQKRFVSVQPTLVSSVAYLKLLPKDQSLIVIQLVSAGNSWIILFLVYWENAKMITALNKLYSHIDKLSYFVLVSLCSMNNDEQALTGLPH